MRKSSQYLFTNQTMNSDRLLSLNPCSAHDRARRPTIPIPSVEMQTDRARETETEKAHLLAAARIARARARQRKSVIGREGRSEERTAIGAVLGCSINTHRSPHKESDPLGKRSWIRLSESSCLTSTHAAANTTLPGQSILCSSLSYQSQVQGSPEDAILGNPPAPTVTATATEIMESSPPASLFRRITNFGE
jgi:hypothetical protein